MCDQEAMTIAVVSMTMMEFAIAKIIKMIAVGHLLMTNSLVIARAGQRRTARGMSFIDCDGMLFIVIALAIMQVAIMQVIDMAIV